VSDYESTDRADELDAPFRQKAVDHHTGSRDAFLKRCQQAASEALGQGRQGIEKLAPYLLNRIADWRTLRAAWDHCATKGGSAPGQNGWRYRDHDQPDIGNLLRAMGKAICAGTFRRGKDKKRKIPKDSGQGHRVITIPNIEDRVVERAVVEIIQPLTDPLFDPHSLGYRPGRGRTHALALAKRHALTQQRLVWVTQDIKNAFDNVPVDRLLNVVRKHLPDDKVLQLIERLIRKRINGKQTKQGVRQGGNLSPLMLNAYLHHFLDRVWRQLHPHIPLIRFADDILLLCRTEEEAAQAHQKLKHLLEQAGMPLKHSFEEALCNLAEGGKTDWLGYSIRYEHEELVVRVGTKSWKRLRRRLAECHEKPSASRRAVQVIRGWIAAQGPCYPFIDRDRAFDLLKSIAGKLTFDEMPSRERVKKLWQVAFARWCRLQNKINQQMEQGAVAVPLE
jgi:group II intron reverse transcriptase/maturase